MSMTRCTAGYQRHWFTWYGEVGEPSRVCVRTGCKAPNPNWPRQYAPEVIVRVEQIIVTSKADAYDRGS